jgi:hypothetical protein
MYIVPTMKKGILNPKYLFKSPPMTDPEILEMLKEI